MNSKRRWIDGTTLEERVMGQRPNGTDRGKLIRAWLGLSLLTFGLPACSLLDQTGHYFQALFGQAEPDYEALEKDRAAQGASDLARPTESLEPVWTGFRGPNGAGISSESIDTTWPDGGLPLLWKQPCGGGYGSFAVAGGLAVALEQRRAREVVVAYDLETGIEVWTHGYEALYESGMGDGPRSTPTWFDGRLITVGATGEVRCLDASDGTLRWRANVIADDSSAEVLDYGLSASPLVVGDLVIVLSGAPGSSRAVRALLLEDGTPVWWTVQEPAAYATPVLFSRNGEPELLVHTASRLVALEPRSGKLIWEHPWEVFQGLTCSQPTPIAPNRVLVSSGYGVGSELIEIGDDGAVRSIWKSLQLKSKFNSPVVSDGAIFGLDEGILTCLDLATGRRLWKEGRFGYGQILLADDHLIVLSEEGKLILLEASRNECVVLARFPAIEGMTWNVPALAHGRLLVRNAAQMACFDVTPK
ncbi:MAG: PQQ-binding-like beta-propeller repeat protein [Planctomycetota bacterium]